VLVDAYNGTLENQYISPDGVQPVRRVARRRLRHADGSPSGDGFNAAWRAGYLFDTAVARVGPIVGLNYSRVWIDSYIERGDDLLTQAVARQNLEGLTESLGVQFRLPASLWTQRFNPFLNLTAEHDFRGRRPHDHDRADLRSRPADHDADRRRLRADLRQGGGRHQRRPRSKLQRRVHGRVHVRALGRKPVRRHGGRNGPPVTAKQRRVRSNEEKMRTTRSVNRFSVACKPVEAGR